MANLPLLILLLATNSWSAPADEPIRVDLPVYDQPEAASVLLAHPLEPENHGGLRNDKSLLGNLIPQKQDINVQRSQTLPAGTVNVQGGQGWLAEPVSTLEGALLEAEGLGSKALSVKDNLHGVVAGLFQPKPIVDTIKEEEKYGNNGDKFYTAGRAIVGGAERVSNLINSALEVPGSILMKVARAASEKLNNFGGRLIGL